MKISDEDKPHQPEARHVRLRTRVVQDKTKYNRKNKHKNNNHE